MRLSSNRVLFVIARVLESLVGLVFLVAAFLKALDPQSFAEQIAMYGIFPELAPVAAWVLIALEVALATGLVLNLFPRIIPLATIALLVFFIIITFYGMALGLDESCGCFGNLVDRGPEQVIVEDILMMIALVFSVVVLWSHRPRHSGLRLAGTLAITLLALVVTLLHPMLPVDDFVTQLKPGAQFASWPVDGLYGKDLNSETHVVFLFTIEDPEIRAQVERMNEIAQQEGVPSAVGLIIDGTEHLTTLMFEYAAAFPVAAIEPRFARPLYRTLPRAFLLHEGEVVRTWSELPAADIVVQAIHSATS
jgi:putative oxidoreductase